MARRPAKNKSARKIDFSEEVKYFEADEDVELVVKKATWEDGDQYPYIAIEFGGVGEYEESVLYHNASTSPKSLFRLRALLEALGQEVPEGEMDIDTDELVDLHCMGHTFEDRYKGDDGKERSTVKVDDFWPVDDEKDKKSGKEKDKGAGKGKSKKDEPEKLDEDDVRKMNRKKLVALIDEHDLGDDVDPDSKKLKKDDEALLEAVIDALKEKDLLEEAAEVEKLDKADVEAMSRKKLIALIEEHDLEDVDPDSKKLKKDDDALLAAILEALEEKDLLAEEEKKPSGKAGSKSGSGKSEKKSDDKTWSEEDVQGMDEDELIKLVEEAELSIDLDDFRTLRKKKNAVIDALGDADKLDK